MRWLSRHFPTLAKLDAAEWMALVVTIGIWWAIIWGVTQPLFLEAGECALAYEPVC